MPDDDERPLEELPPELVLRVQEYYVWRHFAERAWAKTGHRERRQAHRWQRHQPARPAAPVLAWRSGPHPSPRRPWVPTGRTWGRRT